MARFIEEFYYGNIEPQARSTKQNKTVQKQTEILMKNEELLTNALTDELKKWFLDYTNAWSIVNGESTLDSFITGFRLGANFAYEAFVSTETPFESLLKEQGGLPMKSIFEQSGGTYTMQGDYRLPDLELPPE